MIIPSRPTAPTVQPDPLLGVVPPPVVAALVVAAPVVAAPDVAPSVDDVPPLDDVVVAPVVAELVLGSQRRQGVVGHREAPVGAGAGVRAHRVGADAGLVVVGPGRVASGAGGRGAGARVGRRHVGEGGAAQSGQEGERGNREFETWDSHCAGASQMPPPAATEASRRFCHVTARHRAGVALTAARD